MPPTLYIKNALRLAELGLGDGTAYYTGSSAVVDQANKQFDLTTITRIADLAAPVDDTLNGHILYFPASGNKYHIVDFVASTDKVTTWEVPQTTDVGAWEVRRALVDKKALAGNPALRLADGQRFSKWKRSVTGAITIALPNLIKKNNGFESGDLSGWITILGTPSVNSSSPILGKYDAAIGANDRLWALMRGPFEERTYRVLFKARAASGSAGFSLHFFTLGMNAALDYVWSNQSSGTTTSTAWKPALGTGNEWHWADITINTRHEGDAYLAIDNIGSGASALNLDEVYVFEKVDVGAVWLIDEVNSSGYRPEITGYYADPARTSIGASDNSILRSDIVLGHHKLAEFTSGVFPIYKINFVGIAPSASQILLCERFAMPFEPTLPFRPNQLKNHEKVFTTRSGIEKRIRSFQSRERQGTFEALPDADLKRYLEDWIPHHFDDHYPFAVRWADGESPMLMINNDPEAGEIYNNLLPDWRFKFKEVIG